MWYAIGTSLRVGGQMGTAKTRLAMVAALAISGRAGLRMEKGWSLRNKR